MKEIYKGIDIEIKQDGMFITSNYGDKSFIVRMDNDGDHTKQVLSNTKSLIDKI